MSSLKALKKVLEEEALKIAGNICCNDCIANFQSCKFSSGQGLPRVGVGATCPLEKYKVVEPAKASAFVQKKVTVDDCYTVCANCEHATVTKQKKGFFAVDIKDAFESFCLDCPVQMLRDCIQENEAEARMS